MLQPTVRAWCGPHVNPEGIQSSSPGLAFFANPGNGSTKRSNPNGVASATVGSSKIQNRHNPFQGCELISLSSQGWLNHANPGLEDKTPSGFIPPINSARCPGELTIELPLNGSGRFRNALTTGLKPGVIE
jgi:hypothetical protein